MKNTKYISLCAFVGVIFSTNVTSAEREQLLDKTEYLNTLSKSSPIIYHSPGRLLGLTPSNKLEIIKQHAENGFTYSRYRQYYKGLPVINESAVLKINDKGEVSSAFGSIIRKIDTDNLNLEPTISKKKALLLVKQWHSENNKQVFDFIDVEDIKQGLAIGLDSRNKARLVYQISFLIHGDSPSKPYFEIDAHNGQVLKYRDSLLHFDATGPGGNERIGRYEYGTDYDFLKVRQEGALCIMENNDVRTIDLEGNRQGNDAYTFGCPENSPPPINGAYSPINDAHFFATQVYAMYRDWIGVDVLPFQVKMKLNYGQNFKNAFWSGDSFYMGDGGQTLFSFASMDLVAHEMSHGFTIQHSNLMYEGQSGGLNESFSDMVGETLEHYINNSNDWAVGADLFKQAGRAIRYMDEPTRDGQSIANASDYTDDMDVHYSAGVFNKAFYLIATSEYWNLKKAFQIFARANMYYWTESVDWVTAAEAVRIAAMDLGYDTCVVDEAFSAVGVFPNSPPDYCRADSLRHGVPVNGLSGNAGEELIFSMWAPYDSTQVSFEIYGGSGDADLYVKENEIPTTSSYDCRPYKKGNSELCTLSPTGGQVGLTEPGYYFYVVVRGYRSFSDVSLVGRFSIIPDQVDQVYSDITLAQNEWKYYRVTVPDGYQNLSISTSGGAGDVDLYVLKDSQPSTSNFDCRPYRWGNEESCDFSSPEGSWYIGLRGYSPSSGVTLTIKGTR
ncbi:M4 family metallopeptidase [Pleionea sediminis]|uniref:M4 family metallopeptidase n=1 Tax=Pleionea sediminis TaxID=2569479 RepID=UPI0011863DD3|nr:M4 family metallopeptidase [Pleionea sediminis]